MLSLIWCELYKLKRTPFVVLVALAACLFPIPATLVSMRGGTDGSFLSLSFLLLTILAGPLLLPVVGGCLAVLLFHRERDWETLKNLYTVPVRWSGWWRPSSSWSIWAVSSFRWSACWPWLPPPA